MKTNEKINDFIVQPEEYRDLGTPPQWAFHPHLNVLLTSTPLFCDELEEVLPPAVDEDGFECQSVTAVLTVFATPPTALLASMQEELFLFLHGQLHFYRGVSFPPPVSARIVSHNKFGDFSELQYLRYGMRKVEQELQDRATLQEAIRIKDSRDYRALIVDAADEQGDGRAVLLERRIKRMKPEYEAKRTEVMAAAKNAMEAERLAYAEIGDTPPPRINRRKKDKSTPEEKAWAGWVERMKSAYVESRLRVLLENPAARPTEWAECRDKMIRSRAGKIDRGIVDAFGQPQQPHTQEELDRGASKAIALLEATELMFDYDWVTVCRLEQRGITML